MFAIPTFLLTSFVVATIAKALKPGRDPDVGMLLLIGMAAQFLGGIAGFFIGVGGGRQLWSLVLSIGIATLLLSAYRDHAAKPEQAQEPPLPRLPLWHRLVGATGWAAIGAVLMGATGFLIGFFGPLHFHPGSNQGPMVGLFITGPGGVLVGLVLGAALKMIYPEWSDSRQMLMVNGANFVWALFVLQLIVDPRWWGR